MDFLRLIRSVEELLYEVRTWLVFYPRTMRRIIAHPAAMTLYSEDEELDAATEPYTETLSPLLLLILTILVAHGLELGLNLKMPALESPLGKAIWGSDQNILILRSVLFSVFPLVAATVALKRRRPETLILVPLPCWKDLSSEAIRGPGHRSSGLALRLRPGAAKRCYLNLRARPLGGGGKRRSHIPIVFSPFWTVPSAQSVFPLSEVDNVTLPASPPSLVK